MPKVSAAKIPESVYNHLNVTRELIMMSRAGLSPELRKDGISISYKGRRLNFHRGEDAYFGEELSMVTERFGYEIYEPLRIWGKTVVDIGAFIGDSAIYFALNGARHVYSFEPYPYSYGVAKKNIEANGLQDKITLVNEGCGEKGVFLVDEGHMNKPYSDLKNFARGKAVRTTGLDEIVERYGVGGGSLMKVDCEGCENSLMSKASPRALRLFDQIMVEYHYGRSRIAKKLRRLGFAIKMAGRARNFYDPVAKDPNMFMGTFIAEKKTG